MSCQRKRNSFLVQQLRRGMQNSMLRLMIILTSIWVSNYPSWSLLSIIGRFLFIYIAKLLQLNLKIFFCGC